MRTTAGGSTGHFCEIKERVSVEQANGHEPVKGDIFVGPHNAPRGAYLGIRPRDSHGARYSGVLVTGVDPGSPAEAVGFGQRRDFVIVAIDGRPVDSSEELHDLLHGIPAGSEATFTVVWQRGRRQEDVVVRLDSDRVGRRGYILPLFPGRQGGFAACRRLGRTLFCQEPMVSAPRKVSADDVTLRVDTEGQGVCGAWRVDGSEGALPEEKAMAGARGPVEANDVTLRADAARLGVYGAGDIDGGEDSLAE